MKGIDQIQIFCYECKVCRMKWIHKKRVCYAHTLKRKSPGRFCPYHEGKPKWELLQESTETRLEAVKNQRQQQTQLTNHTNN